jgi:hypothetical protein
MSHVSRPSTAITVPQRRGLSARYIQAGLPRSSVMRPGERIQVDCTRSISVVPENFAPIALRTIDRPPSHPTR